jgi:hypothetical protein
MKLTLLAGAILLLTGCASGPDKLQPYTFNEIQVINNSDRLIRNMTVTMTDSGKTIDCDNLIAFGLCSERFGRTAYNQAPIIVDWTFGDRERQIDEIEISVPAYNSPGNPLYAVLEISPAGVLEAYMVQAIPP